ncbi:MAG: exonuclease SbcCD subunit D [bacterium]
MKVAITADVHLTTRKDHPERFRALENILEQMFVADLRTLIIAGDLFDESSRNYAEFDQICKKKKYKGIHFVIIPGNHDARLNNKSITAENVEILNQPTLKVFNSDELPFLFLPYQPDKTMGEFIAAQSSELPANNWVLISHGDWAEGIREPNPLEPGVYLPLTRMDIENYKPTTVVLGHIHKALDKARVHYVGSPCGLDITETGRRRFLIIDTENGDTTSQTVASDFIFVNESLIILPLKDEKMYVKNAMADILKKWDFQKDEIPRVRIQLKVRGYSSNKRVLLNTIKACLQGFTFYRDGEPDLSDVADADDVNRAEIANQVSARIAELNWLSGTEQPNKDQILLEALHVIYGN